MKVRLAQLDTLPSAASCEPAWCRAPLMDFPFPQPQRTVFHSLEVHPCLFTACSTQAPPEPQR